MVKLEKYIECLEIITSGPKVKKMYKEHGSRELVKLSTNMYWGSLDALKATDLETHSICHIIMLCSSSFYEAPVPTTVVEYGGLTNPLSPEENLKSIYDVYARVKSENNAVAVVDLLGTNKAATVCAAILMRDQRWKLTDTVEYMVLKCGFILQIGSYQSDLVQFAAREKLLDDEHKLRLLREDDLDLSYFNGLLDNQQQPSLTTDLLQ